MSVIVVGLNHRTAPVEMRERVAVPASRQAKAVHDLAIREHLAEVVLLSTCNRTEVYARTTRFHDGVDDVRHFLARRITQDAGDQFLLRLGGHGRSSSRERVGRPLGPTGRNTLLIGPPRSCQPSRAARTGGGR